jgi:16S rRNA (uracil1498-N3)-methyltransferase
MPEINEPTGLTQFLGKVKPDSCLICLVNKLEAAPLGMVLDTFAPKSAIILVGPEGGITDEEESLLTGVGSSFASLGPFILRTETAAILGAGSVMSWAFFRTNPSGPIAGE